MTSAPIPTPDTTVAAKRRRALIAGMTDDELVIAAAAYAGATYARGQLARFVADEQAKRAQR